MTQRSKSKVGSTIVQKALSDGTSSMICVPECDLHVSDIFLREEDDRRDGFLDPLSLLKDGPEERIEFGMEENN